MARLLLYQVYLPATLATMSGTTTTTFLFICACLAAVFSVVFSLCGTEKHSKMARENKKRTPIYPPPAEDHKFIGSLSSIMSRKATSLAKMISWKKIGSTDHHEGDNRPAEDEALWKKTIIMGEKCRPIDFSGQILYDSEGNRLPPAPPTELPE